MFEPEQLCTIGDLMFITGRGPVIMTAEWRTGRLGVGDWIELRSAGGDRHTAKIKSIEMVRFRVPRSEYKVDAHNPGGLLLMHIEREHVGKGDAVWSVINPPQVDDVPHKEAVHRKQVWWHLPWWEWLILVGSCSVIFSLYWITATTHVRMLQDHQKAAERRHVLPHHPD